MFVRRGGIEQVIGLNNAAISNNVAAGVDVWGAWDQQNAGLAYPFLLAGVVISGRNLVTRTANGSSSAQKRIWLGVGQGAVGAEVDIARAVFGTAFYLNITGLVDDAVTATGFATYLESRSLAPVLIQPNTRIAVRLRQTGDSSNTGHQVYLIGYDARDLVPTSWPLSPLPFYKGVSKSHSADLPDAAEVTVAWGGSAWAWGPWVQVAASLDSNYLIEGITMALVGFAGNDAQFQIATGGAGSEVPRGAMGTPIVSVFGISFASADLMLPFPFVAFAGERLAIRAAMPTNISRAVRVIATRLHKD